MKTTRLILATAGMLLFSVSCKKDSKGTNNQDDTAKNFTLDTRAAAILETEQYTNELEIAARHVPKNLTQFPHAGNFLNCAVIARTNTPNRTKHHPYL